MIISYRITCLLEKHWLLENYKYRLIAFRGSLPIPLAAARISNYMHHFNDLTDSNDFNELLKNILSNVLDVWNPLIPIWWSWSCLSSSGFIAALTRSPKCLPRQIFESSSLILRRRIRSRLVSKLETLSEFGIAQSFSRFIVFIPSAVSEFTIDHSPRCKEGTIKGRLNCLN